MRRICGGRARSSAKLGAQREREALLRLERMKLLRATLRAMLEAIAPAERVVTKALQTILDSPVDSSAIERVRKGFLKLQKRVPRARERAHLVNIEQTESSFGFRHHPSVGAPSLIRMDIAIIQWCAKDPRLDAAWRAELARLCEELLCVYEESARIVTSFSDYAGLSDPERRGYWPSSSPSDRSPTNMLDVILGAAATWRPSAEARGVEIICEDESLAALPEVLVDSEAARSIASHILHNAVTYTASSPQVSVSAVTRDSGAFCGFTVENQGLCIRKNELMRVFEPGYRGGRASVASPGVGVGLFIAKALAELNGGRIELASEPVDSLRSRVRVTALFRAIQNAPPIPQEPSTRS